MPLQTTQKNALIVLGLTCQVLGLFCFFSVYLMYGAIGFFLVGTILIVWSGKTWYIKLLAITPMLWAAGIIVNALTFERYILPKNFKGVVYVITDQNGEDRKYDFFTRIFEIPSSGVLFTKFRQQVGFNNRQFFITDSTGHLKEMGVLDYRDYIEKWVINPPKTEPSRDSFAIFTPNLEYDFELKRYNMVFTVGKYKDTKVWNYLPSEQIDSLRNQLPH